MGQKQEVGFGLPQTLPSSEEPNSSWFLLWLLPRLTYLILQRTAYLCLWFESQNLLLL